MSSKLGKAATLYYFVNGVPTSEQIKKATDLAEKVEFVDLATIDLNSEYVNPRIVYVAGEVPETYATANVLDKPPVKDQVAKQSAKETAVK